MITLKTLKQKNCAGALLYCNECGGEYSADSSDYFMARDTYEFKCCEMPLALITKKTIYEAL